MGAATHYRSSSKGPVPIATMNYNHALNARDKLAREQNLGERHPRQDELDALNAHLAVLEAEQEVEAQVNG
jgi:hypothetical protein